VDLLDGSGPRSAAREQPALRGLDGPVQGLDLIDTAEMSPVLRALLQISDAVLRGNHFDQMLEVIAEQAMIALGAASVSISKWEPDRHALRTLINVGQLGDTEERWPVAEYYDIREDSALVALLQDGRPYLNAVDDENCSPESRAFLERLGKECELAVPIMDGSTMWGEIWASATDGRRFGHDATQLLQAIAAQAALAIGRTDLLTTVWGYAYEDALTGIPNRRAVDRRFEELDWQDATPVLLMCDLDGFKQVNDRDGHPVGDQLLRDVAAVLAEMTERIDGALAARLGGDEFCVVLPDATIAVAQRFADEASQTISARASAEVGVSWGAAAASADIATGHDLLIAADAALLEAKRHGTARFSSVVPTSDLPGGDGRGNRPVAAREAAPQFASSVVTTLRENPDLTPVEALEVLALRLQRVTDICAYAVSVVTADGTAVTTPRKIDTMFSPESGLAILTDLGVAAGQLSNYPESARAVAEADTFVAAVGLEGSDPAELALLEKLGYQAVLGVGVHGARKRYLVEFYSSEGHEDLAEFAALVQVLAHYCVSGATDRP
jgi:diguanylate cyclase (GGDEF)-like protein